MISAVTDQSMAEKIKGNDLNNRPAGGGGKKRETRSGGGPGRVSEEVSGGARPPVAQGRQEAGSVGAVTT